MHSKVACRRWPFQLTALEPVNLDCAWLVSTTLPPVKLQMLAFDHRPMHRKHHCPPTGLDCGSHASPGRMHHRSKTWLCQLGGQSELPRMNWCIDTLWTVTKRTIISTIPALTACPPTPNPHCQSLSSSLPCIVHWLWPLHPD